MQYSTPPMGRNRASCSPFVSLINANKTKLDDFVNYGKRFGTVPSAPHTRSFGDTRLRARTNFQEPAHRDARRHAAQSW